MCSKIRRSVKLHSAAPIHTVPAGATVERLDTVALAVSSSSIRTRLAAGESPPELPPPVLAYIRERRLYAALSAEARPSGGGRTSA